MFANRGLAKRANTMKGSAGQPRKCYLWARARQAAAIAAAARIPVLIRRLLDCCLVAEAGSRTKSADYEPVHLGDVISSTASMQRVQLERIHAAVRSQVCPRSWPRQLKSACNPSHRVNYYKTLFLLCSKWTWLPSCRLEHWLRGTIGTLPSLRASMPARSGHGMSSS